MAGYPTTDTWDTLVDEVLTKLSGFTEIRDQMCSLSGGITSSDTTISVDAADVATRGVIEIDQELIYVSQESSGTLTIPSWGRGWKGTTAASHSDGAAVYVAPTYPRSIVAREVNNAVRDVWPVLFAPSTTSFTVDSINWQYEMPADCERILSVSWKFDSIDGWRPLGAYELAVSQDTTTFTTGKFLAIADPLIIGCDVHVVYAARPTQFSASTDAFTTTTGLPASAREVIILGASARLAPWIDAGRLTVTTVASDVMAQNKPVGNSIIVGRELRNQYLQRLESERKAQALLYPVRSHSVRW